MYSFSTPFWATYLPQHFFWNNPKIYSHPDVTSRAYSFHFILLAFAVRTVLQNVSLKKTIRKMGNENDMVHRFALID
jgi:hypothetical protein